MCGSYQIDVLKHLGDKNLGPLLESKFLYTFHFTKIENFKMKMFYF